MQSLFGSETDAVQERKLVKRLLRKKKNYLHFDRTLRIDLSLTEYRV